MTAIRVPSENFFEVSAFPRILVVDRVPEMNPILERVLGHLGFQIKVVGDGDVVAAAVRDWMPEAILFNACINDVATFGAIASLRRITDVPILIISGCSTTHDSVLVRTRDAQGYMAERFDWQEVAAYIHARLRRPLIVTYADLAIDVTHRKAARAGRAIELSAREFDLLLTLAIHPDQLFTASQLLDLVWGLDGNATAACVETYICYLRSKIDDGGKPLIQTRCGVGYTMSLAR